MESQLRRPHGQHEEETHATALHGGVHGEHVHVHDEHHDSKSSGIIKKVKAKAKKLKDTIKKHSHLHGHHDHDRQHIPHDHDLDEEDTEEDDVDIVQDPQVHGAPMYEPVVAIRTAHMQTEPPVQPRTDLGGLSSITEDPSAPKHGTRKEPSHVSDPNKHSGIAFGTSTTKDDPLAPRDRTNVNVRNYPYPSFATSRDDVDTPRSAPASISQGVHQEGFTDPSKTFIKGQEEAPGIPKVNLERPKDLIEDPAAPKDRFSGYTASNYETKVTDLTGKGGEEVGITPTIDKMDVYNKARQGPSNLSNTGSHDWVFPKSADASKFKDRYPHDCMTDRRPANLSSYTQIPENLEPGLETYDTTKSREQANQSSYTDKVSSATNAVADKAVSAKDYVASKLGYGVQEEEKQRQGAQETFKGRFGDKGPSRPTEQGTYTGMVSSATSAVADKAASAKDYVASKIGYGGEEEHVGLHGKEAGRSEGFDTKMHPKGGYAADSPTDQSSSYTEKISSAAAAVPSVITGSAIAAKDVVASKLGYGAEKDDSRVHEEGAGRTEGFTTTKHPEYDHPAHKSTDQVDSSYTGKITSAAAAVPAAITSTATSAKNVVASKLGYDQEVDDKQSPASGHRKHAQDDYPTEKGASYARKMSSVDAAVPAPITDTVVSAKDTVASKLGYGERDEKHPTYGEEELGRVAGLSAKHESGFTKHSHDDYATEKATNQSDIYTGKISSAAAAIPSAIASTAVSAKDVMASKLGYGDKDEQHHTYEGEELGPVAGLSKKHETEVNQGSGYTEKISSAAGTIADTAVSAKDAVAAKLGLGEKHQVYGKEELGPVGGLSTKHEIVDTGEEQKGVSMTGYIAEKSKPGSEDKALSELISETLHLDKGEADKPGCGGTHQPSCKAIESEEVTKSFGPDEGGHQESYQPWQKVTVEEVTRRPGSDYDEYGEKVEASYVSAAESSIVNKIKGAVTSLLAREDDSSQTPQEIIESSHGQNQGGAEGQEAGYHGKIVGKHWLQDSGN